MSESQLEAADTGEISAASASQTDSSPPFSIQSEHLSVIDGGVPVGTAKSLAEVEGFKIIYREQRFNRASFTGAWREQEIDGYPGRTGGIYVKDGAIEVRGDTPVPDDATTKALLAAHAAANFP